MRFWRNLHRRWAVLSRNQTIRTIVKVFGLWVITMVVLLLATPGWFISWAGHFGLFMTAIIVLLTTAVALNPSNNTRGTRWVGGGLVGIIVAIFIAAVIHKYFFMDHGETPTSLRSSKEGSRTPTPSPTQTCDPTQGMCLRILQHNDVLDVVVPEFKTFSVKDCEGDVHYTATWEDDGGQKTSGGECREINTPGEMYKNLSGVPHDIRVIFTGGPNGGSLRTTLE